VQDRLYQSDFDRLLVGDSESDVAPLSQLEKHPTKKKSK
jgi:hypothetical protein